MANCQFGVQREPWLGLKAIEMHKPTKRRDAVELICHNCVWVKHWLYNTSAYAALACTVSKAFVNGIYQWIHPGGYTARKSRCGQLGSSSQYRMKCRSTNGNSSRNAGLSLNASPSWTDSYIFRYYPTHTPRQHPETVDPEQTSVCICVFNKTGVSGFEYIFWTFGKCLVSSPSRSHVFFSDIHSKSDLNN